MDVMEAPASYPVAPFAPPERRLARSRRVRTPTLSVVIVNHHHWRATARLVSQLRQSPSMRLGLAEILIVDNHSPFHPLASRLRRLPGVSLRRWGRNRGFATAVNEGSRLSQGRWILLLNPDISLPTDFLENLLDLANHFEDQEPRAGIVGLGLLNTDGSPQGSTGPFPTLASTLARLALPRTRRKYHLLDLPGRTQVDWVTGCCVLIRQDCFQDLGGFDENFFLYYEDVDLCRRAQARNWSVWHEPSLRVVHHRPLHQRQVPAHLRLFTRHALLTYGSKHWPGWQARFLARVVQGEAWARRGLARVRGRQQEAELFARLGDLACDFAHRRGDQARQRLERVVRRREPQRVR